DQDDVWHPEKLASIEATFADHPEAGAVCSDAELVDEHLRPLGSTLWQALNFVPGARGRSGGSRRAADAPILKPMLGLTLALHARFREAILPFPPEHGHDVWAALVIDCLSGIALIERPLVKYRQHPRQQYGVTATTGIRQRLAATRLCGRASFDSAASFYEQACRRIRELGLAEAHAERWGFLRDKAEHLRARARLPERRLSRLPIISRELGLMRYHHYSNGAWSAAKDLFIL
ncbi:MAG: hypothetical protein ACRD68_13280, partial [Pyrinomonadaceae bacterium]